MAEQSLDLRSAVSTLLRRRRALFAAAVLGAALGLAFVVLRPPMYVSESLVLLPSTVGVDGQAAARDVQTEISIASSAAVLGPAGETLTPKMSAADLARIVEVTSTSLDVLKVEATAETASRAQAIAQAVADSEAAYTTKLGSSMTDAKAASLTERQEELQATLESVTQQVETTRARSRRQGPNTSGGRADASALAQLTAEQANIVLQIDKLEDEATNTNERPGTAATVIQDASPGERAGLVTAVIISTLVGLGVVLSVAAIAVLARARRDQRLRYRDDIADAVGVPVLASVSSQAPQTVGAWTSLLHGYAPTSAEAWSYRQVLRTLGLRDSFTARGQTLESEQHRPISVTVVTLSEDLRALAVGPQLAMYAASSGVSTRLVAAQGHESAAALWRACSRKPEDQELRSGLAVDTRPDESWEGTLTIQVVVVDRMKPELATPERAPRRATDPPAGLPGVTATVLAVSPGSATGEELARSAVAADDASRDIVGVIVADPDNLDRTTGRLLHVEREQQVQLPTRLTGASTPPSMNVLKLPRRRG